MKTNIHTLAVSYANAHKSAAAAGGIHILCATLDSDGDITGYVAIEHPRPVDDAPAVIGIIGGTWSDIFDAPEDNPTPKDDAKTQRDYHAQEYTNNEVRGYAWDHDMIDA
jgi:hypothetical protein